MNESSKDPTPDIESVETADRYAPPLPDHYPNIISFDEITDPQVDAEPATTDEREGGETADERGWGVTTDKRR